MPFPHQHLATKISDELNVLADQLKTRTRASLTDANHWLESVMAHFLGALMGWELINLNAEQSNYPAADLGDKSKRIAIQITNQDDPGKITETADKAIKHELQVDFDKLIIFFLLPQKPKTPKAFTQPANGPIIETWDIADLLKRMPELPDQGCLEAAAAVLTRALGLSEEIAPIYPSNLPGGYTNRIFLGRDDFLEKLRFSIHSQTHATAITQASPNLRSGISDLKSSPAATSLNGLGGIGKTHAAIAYADRYRSDYTAILFVSGDSPDRLRSSLAGLCDVLDLDAQGNLPPDEPTRFAAAAKWLASHAGWLLIVDNVDDEAAAIELTQLLSQLTTGHVLITTRLRGWADNVEALGLSVLSPDAATELLRALAKDRRGDKSSDHAPARLLADLLERLPLAIQQAAGCINEQRLSFDQAVAYYQERASELLGWFSDITIPYQAPEQVGSGPVLFTLKPSFEKLDPEARDWLRIFAHYAPEPIPEFLLKSRPEQSDEVKALHRAGLAALAQAEKYSLLTRDPEQPQFKIHRLVQQIIRLEASEEENATALAEGIQLMMLSDSGAAQDVRTWPRWNPLQAHAQALCAHAPDEPDPEGLSWLLSQLGCFFDTKGQPFESEKYYRRALAVAEASLGKDRPEVATCLNNLAQLLQATDRLSEAEPLIRRALAVAEISLGKDDPEVATCLSNLAQLLQATNRHAEAKPLIHRALAIDEANFGKDHPNVAVHLNNHAQLLKVANRHAEAEALIRRALAIDEACFGKDHTTVATDLNNVAQLLQETNRFDEAEPLMRRALAIEEASFGEDHPNVAICLSNLAALLHSTLRPDEAEPLMRRALAIDEAGFGQDHPRVATNLNNLAALLRATHRRGEAESLLRRGVAIFITSYGPDHPSTDTMRSNLNDLLASQGKLSES